MGNTQKKLGLSLRGGGARCAAYLGVFKAFEENGIRIDYIIGASGGTVVGATYAAGKSIDEIIEHFQGFTARKYIGIGSFLDFSVISLEKALAYEREMIGDMKIQDTKIKFWAQATNLGTCTVNYLNEGCLAEAVMASCALPGITKPVEFDGKKYVDGELSGGYGVNFLKKRGAEVIIGMNTQHVHNPGRMENLYERYFASISIATSVMLEKDLQLSPVDFMFDRMSNGVGLLEFDKVDEMVEQGYEMANVAMDRIKELLFEA